MRVPNGRVYLHVIKEGLGIKCMQAMQQCTFCLHVLHVDNMIFHQFWLLFNNTDCPK